MPPPPTVLRTLVPTVAIDAFSASLSTRRDPSFLSELSHHVDQHGPTGLITGDATAATSPQPLTHQPDKSIPVADGVQAVQRSVGSWRRMWPTRSLLMTAPPIDPVPISLPVISADAAERRASTDAAIPASKEPEGTGLPAESSGNPITVGEIASGPALSAQSSDVTAQRQAPGERAVPQRRRLGLGPPLSDPGADQARVVVPRPLVARFEGRRPPGDLGGMTPPSGHRTRTEPEVSAAKPPTKAPLIGAQRPSPVVDPSISQPTSDTGTGTGPAIGQPALQRSPTSAQASADNLDLRSPAPAPGRVPPAEPGLVIAMLSDLATAEPAGRAQPHEPAVQRELSDSADPTIIPRQVEVAPLVGHRPRTRILDTWPGTTAPSPSLQERATPRVSRDYQVQRSLYAGPLASGGAPAGSEAAHWQQPYGYLDPGEIAVSRGLARRDDDGSVVFNVRPSASRPARVPHLSARSDESGVWHSVASSPDTVQRQAVESPAGIAEPSPDTASAATVPVSSPSPGRSSALAGPSAAASPAAPGVPIDELARQLFGPLSARLKAELRLERERVGLLTDLRQ